MKISVIIPAFNAERWVAQCLENILCQSHPALEIIVVDDGSTDGTAAIVEEYAAGRAPEHREIKLIRQANAGPSVARNVGIDAATGDYIHFMDVDDLVNIDFYARMAASIELTGADIACSGITNELNPYWSQAWDERWVLVDAEDKFVHLNTYEFGYCWCYLFRRAFLLERGLRFEPGHLIEDMPFVQHATLWANKVVTVPGATYCYKNRASSTMNRCDRSQRERIKSDWKRAAAARKAFVIEHGLHKSLPRTHVWQWKVLGLPLIIKKQGARERGIRWYFLGLKIVDHKRLRDQQKKL